MKQYISRFLYILANAKKKLLILMIVLVFTTVLEALGISLIGPFLRLVEQPNSIYDIPILELLYTWSASESAEQFIPKLAILISIVFCVKSFLYFLARSYIFKFAFDQKRYITLKLLDSYLSAPYTFHLKRNTAGLIKNIVFETQQFNINFLLPFLNASASFIVICIFLILLANTDLYLLLLLLGTLLPYIFLFYFLGDRFKRWGQVQSRSQQNIIRVINHSLGGLKETKIVGCEQYFEDQLDQYASDYSRVTTFAKSALLLPRILIETNLLVFILLFVAFSYLLFDQDIQSLTSVMSVFAVAAIRLIPSASQFVQSLGKIRNASNALNMIYFDLLESDRKHLDSAERKSNGMSNKGKIQSSGSAEISFNRNVELLKVEYYYPGTSEPSIQDFSINFRKGQSIGLIGKSGAGKTTLVDLILGLLEPRSGDIRVDGLSIYSNLRAWQNLIGYIPQSIFLMDESIERNIAFGVPDHLIDTNRVYEAIEKAQLQTLIAELPDGIKTEVGERGVRLSGGQRQRIGIARAIYHEREILVLDEATSALDNETEKLVSDAIRSLAGEKTLIIIAHRLSTVSHCDCIYLLESGQIVKSGNYQEVVVGNFDASSSASNR